MSNKIRKYTSKLVTTSKKKMNSNSLFAAKSTESVWFQPHDSNNKPNTTQKPTIYFKNGITLHLMLTISAFFQKIEQNFCALLQIQTQSAKKKDDRLLCRAVNDKKMTIWSVSNYKSRI